MTDTTFQDYVTPVPASWLNDVNTKTYHDTANTVGYTPGGGLTSTNVQAALTEAASQTRIKNDIINGQFRIAQTGTSFAAPASQAYDLDGWMNFNGSAAVFTVAQVAGETAGKFARQVTITTADVAVAAGDYVDDVTKIEGFNVVKYVNNTFTIAFRAKVPVAGIHCVWLKNSGSDKTYIHEINFPVANTYQDCSFTVVGGLPTAGTWNYTNGVGLVIGFNHMCGSTFQTTADTWNTGNFLATANQVNDCATIGNVWALEDVRMNLGTFCPPDSASYDEDLRTCQRYYQIIQQEQRQYSQAAGAVQTFSYVFPPMRITPTYAQIAAGTLLNCSSAGIICVTGSLAQSNITGAAAGDCYVSGRTYSLAARL
jgi:hypothetical protein